LACLLPLYMSAVMTSRYRGSSCKHWACCNRAIQTFLELHLQNQQLSILTFYVVHLQIVRSSTLAHKSLCIRLYIILVCRNGVHRHDHVSIQSGIVESICKTQLRSNSVFLSDGVHFYLLLN